MRERENVPGVEMKIRTVGIRKGDRISITLMRGNRDVVIAQLKIFNAKSRGKNILIFFNVYQWDERGDDKEDVSFISNEYEMKQFISVTSCIIGRKIEHVLFSKEWNEHIWVVR